MKLRWRRGGKYPSPEESRRYYEWIRQLSKHRPAGEAVRVSELKKLSGLSEKRSEVIAAQLDGAGIIRREKQGVDLLHDFSSDEAFEVFLARMRIVIKTITRNSRP